jgi:predicted GIY-YIG superfamily endonuclease
MSKNRAGYHKEYYAKNKEKVLAKNKEYRDNHKDVLNIKSKERWESGKDGYHTVYLLQSCNYVGVTDNLPHRLRQHKTNGRDCTNYIVLHKTKNREEAHTMESLLHDMGYEGKHSFNSYK